MPPPQPAALVLHASAAYVMYWGFVALDDAEVGQWIRSQKGQHFQFLTIHGLAAAWLTMVVSLIADAFPHQSVLRDAKRGLLMMSMPLAVTVSAIYWSLIAIARELLLMDELLTSEHTAMAAYMRIPFGVDLALHVVPGAALVLDFFFFERRYTKYQAARVAPITAILVGVWYVSLVEYCAGYNGRFPYPFLDNPVYIRMSIYIGAVLQAIVTFRVLNYLHP